MQSKEEPQKPQPLDHPTRLAFDRTRLAEERTLLAWVRTATALITFGFTIFSFFAVASGAGHQHVNTFFGPRLFALLMICVGLISLLIASMQYRRQIALLRAVNPDMAPGSAAGQLGLLIAGLGIAALIILLLPLS
jgi:putative membrane protein